MKYKRKRDKETGRDNHNFFHERNFVAVIIYFFARFSHARVINFKNFVYENINVKVNLIR